VLIKEFFPSGLRGVFIASLIAASTSTMCAYVNSGAAYYVRDIHQAYLFPKASKKHLVHTSSITTVVIMGLGILIGWKFEKINDIWVLNMVGLMSGLMVPNILKWFWWRFNGVGYAVGCFCGLISPIIFREFYIRSIGPDVPEFGIFWISVGASLVGTFIGTFFGKPAPMDTLVAFYQRIRPFGFWSPVRAICQDGLLQYADTENRRDKWLLIPACIFQLLIFWVMTALVVQKWYSFAISVFILFVCGWILKKYWYDNLRNFETSPYNVLQSENEKNEKQL
jgi:hypothetical protein